MSGRFDIDYSRLLRYSLIGACAVGVLALNYCSLSRHMSSNSQKITDYTIPEEYVERNPRPTSLTAVKEAVNPSITYNEIRLFFGVNKIEL